MHYLHYTHSVDKLGVRSVKYEFLGQPKEIARYYFYNPNKQNVFVSKHEHFLEKKFVLEKSNGSKIDLEKVQEPWTNILMEFKPMVAA